MSRRGVETPANLRGFVKAGSKRTAVVKALARGPHTPTELIKSIGLHPSGVSRILADLVSANIAECLTPRRRKGRVYALTPETVVRLRTAEQGDDLQAPKPTPVRETSFAPRVRGEAMIAGIAAATEILGGEGLLALCEACNRDLLDIERDAWYPLDLHHAFLDQIETIGKPPNLALCRRVGRRAVVHLPYLQRFLAGRKLDILALMERAPLLHGHYFNFGRFGVDPIPGGVEIRQFDLLPTPAFCAARAGNYEGVMWGRSFRARVDEVRCETREDAHCAFRIRLPGGGHPGWLTGDL